MIEYSRTHIAARENIHIGAKGSAERILSVPQTGSAIPEPAGSTSGAKRICIVAKCLVDI